MVCLRGLLAAGWRAKQAKIFKRSEGILPERFKTTLIFVSQSLFAVVCRMFFDDLKQLTVKYDTGHR